MKPPGILAHVAQDACGEWREHALDSHLQEVSRLAGGDVEPVLPGLYAQVSDLLYDEALGFIGCSEDASPRAGALVV